MAVKQFTKTFEEFINESNESGFKGLPLNEFMPLITELIGLCDNLNGITYPADIHGHASSVINIEAPNSKEFGQIPKEVAITKLEEGLNTIQQYYDENDADVYFYVWNIYTRGLSHNELEKKLEAIGGMPSYQDIRLPEVIQLLKSEPELARAVTKLNISLASQRSDDFAKAMSSGEFGKLD